MGSINSNVNSCPGEWVIEFKYVLLAYLPAVKGAGLTRGHLTLWHTDERCPCTGGWRIGQASRSREALWDGEPVVRRYCGLLELEFLGQQQPGGTVVKMVYAQSKESNIPSGYCWHLIVPRKRAFTSGVTPVSVCVSGRTGVLPLNHQVLLQRCSWGSASLWHHKVRPNSYGSYFCSAPLLYYLVHSWFSTSL